MNEITPRLTVNDFFCDQSCVGNVSIHLFETDDLKSCRLVSKAFCLSVNAVAQKILIQLMVVSDQKSAFKRIIALNDLIKKMMEPTIFSMPFGVYSCNDSISARLKTQSFYAALFKKKIPSFLSLFDFAGVIAVEDSTSYPGYYGKTFVDMFPSLFPQHSAIHDLQTIAISSLQDLDLAIKQKNLFLVQAILLKNSQEIDSEAIRKSLRLALEVGSEEIFSVLIDHTEKMFFHMDLSKFRDSAVLGGNYNLIIRCDRGFNATPIELLNFAEKNFEMFQICWERMTNKDPNHYTFPPLGGLPHMAAKGNQVNTLQYLVDQGIELHSTYGHRDGYFPLHVAIENNSYEAAQFLLEHGADVNSRSTNGSTGIEIACDDSNGKKELNELLLNQGANIGIEDALLNAVIHAYADPTSKNNTKIVEMLHAKTAFLWKWIKFLPSILLSLTSLKLRYAWYLTSFLFTSSFSDLLWVCQKIATASSRIFKRLLEIF